MESNTKTLLSLTENRDGSFDCVWDNPSEVAMALAQVIACADNADGLLKIILLALAVSFTLDEEREESFIAQLHMKTEQMKHTIEMREKKSEEEE